MYVTFPDGTTVRASALSDRDADDAWRDRGLYLDPAWAPEWAADMIDWPDFGLPVDTGDAAQRIIAAFERARAGARLEIGCHGGLGRTGTVLACMAILAGVPPNDAVAWTRRHYRPDAIETPAQEAWVRWFAARGDEGTGDRG
jgi:hypothetical protein